MKKLLLLFLLLSVKSAFSQNISLEIVVKTDNGETPDFVTLLVKKSSDSTLVHSGTLDEKGNTKIKIQSDQSYYISISKFSYITQNQLFIAKKSDEKLEFTLKNTATNLNEVVITHKEKLMKQDDDKTIVDAEQLAKLASNAFEIIEKVPGVIVVDDNVFLGKAEAAKIYINGREMKITGSDLAAILKSMPPTAIAKIEILRTPSAKYDASSSGGIINIVLKKGVRLGTNGTANVNFNQGRLPRFSAGFTLNHGNDKQNNYFNYQYANRNGYDSLTTNRFFNSDASRFFQRAYTTTPQQSHYIATGFDRTISPTFSIANDLIFNQEKSEPNISNSSTIRSLADEKLLSEIGSELKNESRKININNTLSVIKKLDTIGSEWNSSLNYIFSDANTDQTYRNIFSLQNTSREGVGVIENRRNIGSFTSDFTKKWKNNFKIETGVKIDILSNTSSSNFKVDEKIDNSQSANYTYKENINSAYLQGSKKFYGITLKTGLRMENTNMEGRQTFPSDTTFKVNRTDFFPYLYISRRLFELFKGFAITGNFIARRSITRPNYGILSPAVQYTDPFYLQTGNPALRPQFTNTYEFNLSFEDYPILAVGTDDTKDVFGKVIYQNPTTKIFTETYDNLGKLKQYYLRIVGGIPPGGTYFGIVGATYNYQIYKGLYQGENLDFRRGSWTIFTYHELKFNKTTFMSANGFIRIKGVQNFYELQNIGELSLSLNKKFPKQKLQVILTVNDIFHTFRPDFELKVGGISASGQRSNDTQRVGVTVRYNFGVETNKSKKGKGTNIFDMVNPAKKVD